jgi:hypothetical protein
LAECDAAAQSWIVHDYRNYVLHLERGLEAVNDILATVGSPKSKKTGSGASDEERNTRRLSKLIMRLEEQAAMRGESGLAICLSKPFQRLLKYPLLFQVRPSALCFCSGLIPGSAEPTISVSATAPSLHRLTAVVLQHRRLDNGIRVDPGAGRRARCGCQKHRERQDQRGGAGSSA